MQTRRARTGIVLVGLLLPWAFPLGASAQDQIAFVRDEVAVLRDHLDVGRKEPTTNIYVSGIDGARVREVTDDNPVENDPAWSPNGKHIAFDAMDQRPGPGVPPEGNNIYVIDADAIERLKMRRPTLPQARRETNP